MIAKYKGRPPVVPGPEMPTETPRTPPTTTEECLDRIKSLGLLVDGHIRFMCAAVDMPGSSEEAKRHAAALFWDRLRVFEQALGRIRGEVSRR